MNRYALIVGISQYQNSSLPSLSKPAVSAEAVAKLLETHGNFQEVRRLPANWLSADRAEVGRSLLTAAELSGEIKRLLNEQAIGGEVLIYFSGHGFVVSDNLGGSEAYLAASDTQIGVADNRVIWQQNGIRLRSLAEQFAQAKFSSLVMLLDCCHSGSLIESGVVQQALANASSRDYVLIAACRGFEKAYEGAAETSHSNFTSALLAGLAREQGGENGLISSDRLFDHLSQTLKGTGQQPIRLGLGRSIAIVTYPPSEAIPAETSFNPANPYVGLAAFESFQADYFFGRDAEIRSLLERLDPLQKPTRRFLAVIGPSGSGKSSLVKAGLVPALAKDALPESSQWQIEPLKPGAFPLAALNAAIAKYTDAQPHLLVIDQFEELFTLCQSEEEQRAFLALLNQQVTRADRQARVVITMRADFLDRCARYQESADLINQLQPTTFMVTPLTDDKLAAQLGQAIEEPATRHGVKFQSGLAAQMSSEVRNRLGALPLLQFALTELWKHCIPDGAAEPCLTWAGYEAIGGVGGALQRRADSLYASLTESDRDLLKKLVMELVQIGDGGEVSRRRAERQELWALAAREQVDRLLDRLTAERFLMVDGETVEVAHEALLSEAPRIRGWIEENRENLRLRDRFERDCKEWQEQERSDFYLLNPGKLAAVEEWVANTNPVLSTVESEFVRESVGKRDREIQAQLKLERRLREAAEARFKAERRGKFIAVVTVCLLTGLTGFTLIFALQADFRKKIAIQYLISEPKQLLNEKGQLEALVASVKSLKQLKDLEEDNKEALNEIRSIVNSVQESNRLEGHTGEITGVRFSPTESKLASASADKTIKIWDVEGKVLKTFPAHENLIWNIRFSPNGQNIASASVDKTVKVWDLQGKPLYNINHSSSVYDIKFNSSGDVLASSDADGVIKFSNAANGKFITEFRHNRDSTSVDLKLYIFGLDFHPTNNKLFVYGGLIEGGSVYLLNLENKLSVLLGKHQGAISSVQFSPDGKLVASAGYDGYIKLWSVQAQKQIGEIYSHSGRVNSISFSPNGQSIASGGNDAIVKVWSVNDAINTWKISNKNPLKTPVHFIEGHRAAVNRVEFNSKDNEILISGSEDKTVRIWRLASLKLVSDQPSSIFHKTCFLLKNYLQSNKNLSKDTRNICKIF